MTNPTIYLVHGGNAFAWDGDLACLLVTSLNGDGTLDIENWGPPMSEMLPDNTNAALAKIEAVLRAVPAEIPAP